MVSLILSLILILVLALLLVAKPRMTFYLVLGSLMAFFEPLSQNRLFRIGKTNVYGCDLMMASLFLCLAYRFAHRRFRLRPKSVGLFSGLFLWGALAIARGIPIYSYRAIGEARWYVILPILCYYFVLVTFRDKRWVRQLVKWFLGLLLFTLLFRLIDYYLLGGKDRLPWWALYDPRVMFRFIGATTNLLVAFALISLLLFYMLGEIKKPKALLYTTFGLLLAAIVIPQTRSVWLATAVGLAVLAAFVGVRFARRGLPRQGVFLINVALLSLLFVPLIAGFVGGEIVARIAQSASFFRDPMNDPTGSWRLAGWQQELEKAMQQPLLGQGLGGYSEWFDGQEWQQVAVHNGYIMHFSKFGVVGLLLLFAALVRWYAEMNRYVRTEPDRYYRLLGYAIQACVLMDLVFAFFYDFSIFFWILLAVGTALIRDRYRDRLVTLQSPINGV